MSAVKSVPIYLVSTYGPMRADIPEGRRAAVRAYPMTILRHAASSRADGRADGRMQSDGQNQNRNSDWQWSLGSGPEVDRLVAILRVKISPGLTPKSVSNI